jgi:hypothetical protein
LDFAVGPAAWAGATAGIITARERAMQKDNETIGRFIFIFIKGLLGATDD